MSRQHAVNIVGIDFPASDGERQVPEADGIKPGAQTAVEYEHAAAPVRLGVEQFAVDGQAVQHSVIIQAADHDPRAPVRRLVRTRSTASSPDAVPALTSPAVPQTLSGTARPRPGARTLPPDRPRSACCTILSSSP